MNSEVGSSFATEAYTCLQAVRMGVQEGFLVAIVEGDSRSVIRKCEFDVFDRSEISSIIFSIKTLMKSFQDISFSHVARFGNSIAHLLASKGMKLGVDTYQVGGLSDRFVLPSCGWHPREPIERILGSYCDFCLGNELVFLETANHRFFF